MLNRLLESGNVYLGECNHTYLTMCEFLSWIMAHLVWSGLLAKLCQSREAAASLETSRFFERARARIFVDVSKEIERSSESLSTFPLPLTTRIASTVNNDLDVLVVSHCSFFVNVTHFINKSKRADLRFSETWMLLLKLHEANSQTHDLYYLSAPLEMIEYTI